MREILVIDGYNVIKRCGALIAREKISLHAAREELIRWLALYRGRKRTLDIVAVFDGRPVSGQAGEDTAGMQDTHRTPPGVSVVFANGSADMHIRRMVRTSVHPGSITVVTDDNEVVNNVRSLGARVQSVGEMTAVISKKRASRLPADKNSAVSEKPIPDGPEGRAINEELRRRWNIR